MSRRWRALLAGCGAAVLLALSPWAWWEYRYPEVPDPGELSVQESIQFIASDDFNRMTETHRVEFTKEVIAHQKGRSFEELIAMMLDQSGRVVRERAADNIRGLRDPTQVTSPLIALYLEKFYELSPEKRMVYMTVFVLAQQGRFGSQPIEYHVPDASRFNQVLVKFVGREPRTQALIAQFLLDFQAHRERLGLTGTW